MRYDFLGRICFDEDDIRFIYNLAKDTYVENVICEESGDVEIYLLNHKDENGIPYESNSFDNVIFTDIKTMYELYIDKKCEHI